MTTTTTAADIAAWILPAFAGVDIDDVLTAMRDGLGSDDCPYLSLTERTYTAAFARAYGDWGCEREINWEFGKRGEAFDAARTAMRAAEFVLAFVRRNGRVRLSIRGTLSNGVNRREMIVEAAVNATDLSHVIVSRDSDNAELRKGWTSQ